MKRATPRQEPPEAEGERLQKILASAGIASRRAAEQIIAAGRVTVNGQVVTEMGSRAQPGTDQIAVDGRPIGVQQPGTEHAPIYLALNKPKGIVTTAKDTHGRPTVLDVIKGGHFEERGIRLYPVGRLDADTSGLLLLTNDGDLTFRLTHPRYGVEKEYEVLVRGRVEPAEIQRLRDGAEIEGEKTGSARVEEVRATKETIPHSGSRFTKAASGRSGLMCAAVGHPVLDLQRVRFGPITMGDLQPGRWRFLAVHEVHALRKAVKLKNVVTPTSVPRTPPAGRTRAPGKPTTREERSHEPGPAARATRNRKPGSSVRRPASGAQSRTRRPAASHDRDRRPGGSRKEHDRPAPR